MITLKPCHRCGDHAMMAQCKAMEEMKDPITQATSRSSLASGLHQAFPYCMLAMQSLAVTIIIVEAFFLAQAGHIVATTLLAVWVVVNSIVIIDWLWRAQ